MNRKLFKESGAKGRKGEEVAEIRFLGVNAWVVRRLWPVQLTRLGSNSSSYTLRQYSCIFWWPKQILHSCVSANSQHIITSEYVRVYFIAFIINATCSASPLTVRKVKESSSLTCNQTCSVPQWSRARSKKMMPSQLTD